MERRDSYIVVTTTLAVSLLSAWFGAAQTPVRALPIYARRYAVTCDTCHTVVPSLNGFGMAFQANHFVWPAGEPPADNLGFNAFPISGISVYSSVRDETHQQTAASVDYARLFASNGFALRGGRPGGYFIDYYTNIGNHLPGYLDNAFVSAPVVGAHGQLAVTIGQFAPVMYQFDQINSGTQTQPAALTAGAGYFSYLSAGPGVRLDYFSNRGLGTANGDYLDIGIPYAGHLAFTSVSRWDGPQGAYVHAFRRDGTLTYGALAYTHDADALETLLATYQPTTRVALLGAATAGHIAGMSSTQASLQATWTENSSLALTARLDSMSGNQQPSEVYPVVNLTYYPGHQNVLRLVGESVQDRLARSDAVYVFVQY
jgi:hypothetical protein